MNRQTVWHTLKQMGAISVKVWGGLATIVAFAALAYLFSGEVAAAPAQQTIPQRTPTAAATAVPTVTPTSQTTAPTATNIPAGPTATRTPTGPTATSQPGAPTSTQTPTAQPKPTDTPAVSTTPTAVPAFSLQGEMFVASGVIRQGSEVELRIRIVNPGSETALNVAVRDELPGVLQIVSMEAEGGSASSEAGSNGTSIALFTWPSLAPGGELNATLIVRIAPSVANGSVIDNLAVAYADNAGAVTIGVSLGTPPLLLPTFN